MITVGNNCQVRTLEEAVLLSRSTHDRCIQLEAGTFYLQDTLRLSPEDSGLRISGRGAGKTVVSGGLALKGLAFRPYGNGIWQAAVPEYIGEMDQLFVNGVQFMQARFPKRRPGKKIYGCWSFDERNEYHAELDALLPERVAHWKHPETGTLHAMHCYMWGDNHWKITGVNEDHTLKLVGGWQVNRNTGPHGVCRYVENIFEELTVPGEYFFDARSKVLYLIPLPGMNLEGGTVETSRLTTLVDVEGTSAENPIRDISFENLSFRHSNRTFMETRERLYRSDWAIYRGGAVVFRNTENCRIERCVLEKLGGNAVIFDGYNARGGIGRSILQDLGASGVMFVGSQDAVRNPLFSYDDVPDYEHLDREKGPRSENYPREMTVADCIMRRTGLHEKNSAPVHMSVAHRITVRDCSIYDVPRAGINVNEGTFGGHLIEGCDIFNTVLETEDHGCFNSWGRDRYWQASLVPMDQTMQRHPELIFLDILDRNAIRRNRMRCDHGWDIDLDDGSTNYLIEENLLLKGGLKMREGYGREARHNMIINSSLHLHCWLTNSKDRFYGNFIYDTVQIAGNPIAFGELIDQNVYSCYPEAASEHQELGWNRTSRFLSPVFRNPAEGDYTILNLPEDAPFRNLPMTGYGVKDPALRKLADHPVFPFPKPSHLRRDGQENQPLRTVEWRGMTLRTYHGAQEYSAFGVAPDTKGMVIRDKAVPPFMDNDLIIGIDEEPWNGESALESPAIASVTVVRSQRVMIVSLAGTVAGWHATRP